MTRKPIDRFSSLIGSGGAFAEKFGSALASGFHQLFLFAIGAAIVWSALATFQDLLAKQHATVDDVLLLFIYLELGATVGIYFRTRSLPVRYLIYVAITALTRLLIGMIGVDHSADIHIVTVTASILLLALGILVLRIGSFKYPTPQPAADAEGETDIWRLSGRRNRTNSPVANANARSAKN